MIEREIGTYNNKDNYIVLRVSNDNYKDYVPLFRIPKTDYEYGDLILGNLEYMFLIKNNIIIRYQMNDGKREEFKFDYSNIELLGIKSNYIYFKSTNDNNIEYYKSHFSFHTPLLIKENELPLKYTYTPIFGEQKKYNIKTFN